MNGLVQMDGDGQHDPAYIQALLDTIQRGEADLAIGSRFLETQDSNGARCLIGLLSCGDAECGSSERLLLSLSNRR